MSLTPANTTKEAALLIYKLSNIGLKAKGFSPSPVEIKELLMELDEEELKALKEQCMAVLNGY